MVKNPVIGLSLVISELTNFTGTDCNIYEICGDYIFVGKQK